ncbi:MAG: mechanosensitive ion channel family protein [Bdellovibrionales bacterium]|nr:mechanosensitive ion channel family protein [Bdellovibrionales bacterium]
MNNVLNTIWGEIDWSGAVKSGIRILVWLVAIWISWTLLKSLISRFEKRVVNRTRKQGEPTSEAQKRAETLARLMKQGVSIAVVLILVLGILREIGIDIGPVLASAGVAGLAIGFGAQNLVRDVISGFFMLLENQVRVGDVAVVNGTSGLVEAVNFRTIVLRDLEGTVHVFPNGTISTLSNMTLNWSGYVMDIGVAYKEDLDSVIKTIEEVGAALQESSPLGRFVLEPIEVFGVDDFGDSAIIVKARLKTLPGQQWAVGRHYRKQLKHAFDQKGIEIPFPHRSLYFGEASKEIAVKLVESARRGE